MARDALCPELSLPEQKGGQRSNLHWRPGSITTLGSLAGGGSASSRRCWKGPVVLETHMVMRMSQLPQMDVLRCW